MGHAEIEGETREKKIINLERLIAREKEVEEKKTSDCRLKEGRGRERRERWAFRSKWVFVQSRDTERGGNKYAAAAQKTCLATALPLIRPLKGPDPDGPRMTIKFENMDVKLTNAADDFDSLLLSRAEGAVLGPVSK